MAAGIVDLAWAAGFLEGEGSFDATAATAGVSAVQVQREPVDKLKTLFGGTIYLERRKQKNPRQNDAFRWTAKGARGAGIMMTLFSFMSARRKTQMRASLSAFFARAAHSRYRTHCPQGHAYDETNTYLAPRRNGKHTQDRQCRICRAVVQKEYEVKYPERLRENRRRADAKRAGRIRPSLPE